MNFNHEELMLMMLYNSGTRLGLIHELRLMQCYLMPDETALRELSEGVIEKLKLLTDAEFSELEFPPDLSLPPAGGVYIVMVQVYSTSTNFSMTLNIDWHNIFGVLGRFHYENLLYCSVCQQLLKQYLSDFQSLAKF